MRRSYGDQFQILLVLACTVPLTFFLALARPRRDDVSWGIAVTLFGVVWIGVALAHAVLVRELPHGGAIVLDVLIGTFIGDTAAYFGGRAFGRRPLAPRISPNKTVEGLLCGIVGRHVRVLVRRPTPGRTRAAAASGRTATR